jgi:hypothetical protein
VRLVIGIYKWQSHLPKFLTVKLSQQTVTERFGGHAGLIRKKENSAFSHNQQSRPVAAIRIAAHPRI